MASCLALESQSGFELRSVGKGIDLTAWPFLNPSKRLCGEKYK